MTRIEHITTAELPASIFHGYAYLTATAVSAEGAESHGYVDPSWDRWELFQSRNDVRPISTWNRVEDIEEGESLSESFARFISESVEGEFGAAVHDNGDGSFYGQDSMEDTNDVTWTYALHIVASEHMMRRPSTEYRVSL